MHPETVPSPFSLSQSIDQYRVQFVENEERLDQQMMILQRTNRAVLEELASVRATVARHLSRLNEQEKVIEAQNEQISELWDELREMKA